MGTIKFICYLHLILLLSCNQNKKNAENSIIHGNQLGYYPNSTKIAIVSNSDDTTFTIKNIIGKIVYQGTLSNSVLYDKSGENLRKAVFTDLKEPGKYMLSIKDAKKEFIFEIKENLYKDAFVSVLKNYYFQRTGIDLQEKYAGKWQRKGGHPDTLCYFHPSSLRGKGSMSSPKGWYDAGDYNKYVVNAGVSVGTILNLYEMFPDFVTDGMCNIPESGNGISDLLDEIRYELDWVLTMQTPDGASNHKLTSRQFSGFVMPVEDTSARFIVGKSTAATLNLAAMTAQASRLYQSVDKEFASKCLLASEKAWNWAIKNPEIAFKNPEDIQTGEYGDQNFKEEFWWAASELYISTKKQEYLDFLLKNEMYEKMVVGNSWSNFLGNLGNFSIILADSGISEELKFKVSKILISLADELLAKLDTIPYRISIDDFQWGSNSDILNSAMIFAYAYRLTYGMKYLNAVIESADYIFGKNATGYSFVTGYGSKSPMNIHHRPSGADKTDEPIPGFVVGGPNAARQDEGNGVKYDSKLPAKSYTDVEGSYASNEVCINWNAPAVFVLGFLEATHHQLK